MSVKHWSAAVEFAYCRMSLRSW